MKSPAIEVDSFWLPRAGSTLAEVIDSHFWAVMILSTIFFILVTALSIGFAVRYRRKFAGETTSPIDHNLKLEIVWTSIPVILVMGLFTIGVRGYVEAAVAPRESFEIKVTGEMYLWTFTYPDGTVTVNEFAVPKGRPIKLLMSAKDVLHSFFIPELRLKQDVVPGAYTIAWFEATRTMDTAVLCAEYCGSGHSTMMANLKVLEPSDFAKWVETQATANDSLPPAELGAKLFTTRGCRGCHSIDGSVAQGPTMKGLFGRTETLQDGTTVTADENYVRESILRPAAKVVRGYPPVMPVFQGLLKERELDGLIAYLKTLQ